MPQQIANQAGASTAPTAMSKRRRVALGLLVLLMGYGVCDTELFQAETTEIAEAETDGISDIESLLNQFDEKPVTLSDDIAAENPPIVIPPTSPETSLHNASFHAVPDTSKTPGGLIIQPGPIANRNVAATSPVSQPEPQIRLVGTIDPIE